jgi:hypothetical protein
VPHTAVLQREGRTFRNQSGLLGYLPLREFLVGKSLALKCSTVSTTSCWPTVRRRPSTREFRVPAAATPVIAEQSTMGVLGCGFATRAKAKKCSLDGKPTAAESHNPVI